VEVACEIVASVNKKFTTSWLKPIFFGFLLMEFIIAQVSPKICGLEYKGE
jgi:hypothetical protein